MQRSSFAAVGCQRARYLGVACTSLSNLLRPAESAADIKLSWWQGMLGQQELNTPVVAQWSTHLPARWKTEARAPAIANAASCPRQHDGYHCRFRKPFRIRGSIVVSISPVTRKTRAQFPAAEFAPAGASLVVHGARRGRHACSSSTSLPADPGHGLLDHHCRSASRYHLGLPLLRRLR